MKKRILTIVLAAVMLLGCTGALTACASNGEPEESTAVHDTRISIKDFGGGRRSGR